MKLLNPETGRFNFKLWKGIGNGLLFSAMVYAGGYAVWCWVS